MHFRREILQTVQQIDIRASRNVSSLLVGNYKSAFRGSGMQFKEFRSYEPGDDIRHMSWQVTARTGKPTLKVFEEERELNLLLLVDVSGSTLMGLGSKAKREMFSDIISVLGLATLQSGDRFGVILFGDQPEYYLPPKRNRTQVQKALKHFSEQPFEKKNSALAPILTYADQRIPTRSLVLILSDFLVPPFEKELARLSSRHEVVLLHGYDDSERGYHLDGIYEVRDPETGESFLLDGSSKKLRKNLSQWHTEFGNHLSSVAQKYRADYAPLSVHDDYLKRLVHFFRARGPVRV